MLTLTRSHCRTRLPTYSLYLSHPIRTYATTPAIGSKPKPPSPAKVSTSTTIHPTTATHPIKTPISTPRSTTSPNSTIPFPDLINPPPTARPPPLDLPARSPQTPAYKHYFALGKTYLTFYKSGLKAIYTNYKLARTLPVPLSASTSTLQTALLNSTLTRAQYQLLLRVRGDISKLPPFALVFLICGELAPLVVVWLTGVVPKTLWIPKQVDGVRAAAERRRRETKKAGGVNVDGPVGWSEIQALPLGKRQDMLRYLGKALGVYPRLWDRVLGDVPVALIGGRVEKRIKAIEVDDVALERDGGARGLVEEEVRIACVERGLDTLGLEEGKVRGELFRWLRVRRGKEAEVELEGG